MCSPAKTGSTAIYADLVANPHIQDGVACKELRFWAAATVGNSTLERYRTQFPPHCPGMIAGEASPAYFLKPFAAQRIAQFLPGVRLLVFSRDPVQRFISRLVGNRIALRLRSDLGRLPRTCTDLLLASHHGFGLCAKQTGPNTDGGTHPCCLIGARGVAFPVVSDTCNFREWSHATGLSMGLYADVLQALWLPHFELGRRLLVMPSELFLPGNETSAVRAYQRVARFLHLPTPWTQTELATRPSKRQHHLIGTHHLDSSAEETARQHPPDWACNQSESLGLEAFYAPANAALADIFWRSEAALMRAIPDITPVAWQLPAYLTR
jgi:hypothetical protein